MSASPFRTTAGPFVEVPVPVTPDSLSEAKKNLEDIPFDAEIHEFPVPEMAQPSHSRPSQRWSWFQRFFSGRGERRLREEKLMTELQDLRASYAGLMHSTEDIKHRLESEIDSRLTVTQALSPFPAAVAGLEKVQTRQEEATGILSNIREKLETTSERDEVLLTAMDSVHGGVGKLQSEVGVVHADVKGVHTEVKEVSVAVSEIAEGQASASASLGNFGEKMELRFEEATKLAHENAERLEQSSDDVIQVLRQMEKNSQRSLWVFATLVAVLFIILIVISAQVSRFGNTSAAISSDAAGASEPVMEEVALSAQSITDEPVAEVLVDDFQF